jgi:hypothetical protein
MNKLEWLNLATLSSLVVLPGSNPTKLFLQFTQTLAKVVRKLKRKITTWHKINYAKYTVIGLRPLSLSFKEI